MILFLLIILIVLEFTQTASTNETEPVSLIYYCNCTLYFFRVQFTLKHGPWYFITSEMIEIDLGIRPLPANNEDFKNIHHSALSEIKLATKKVWNWQGDIEVQFPGRFAVSFGEFGVSISLGLVWVDSIKKLVAEKLAVEDDFLLNLNDQEAVSKEKHLFSLIGSAWKPPSLTQTFGRNFLLSQNEVVACFKVQQRIAQLTVRFHRKEILPYASESLKKWLEIEVSLKAGRKLVYFSIQYFQFDFVVKSTRLYPNPAGNTKLFVPTVEYEFDLKKNKIKLKRILKFEEFGALEQDKQDRVEDKGRSRKRKPNEDTIIHYDVKTKQQPNVDSFIICHEIQECK